MKYQILISFLSFCFLVNAQDSQIALSYNNLLFENLDQDVISDSITAEPQKNPSKKSVGAALFLSLLIPGAGEYYADDTFYAKVFLGIEVLAIGSIFLSDHIYESKIKDSRTFAATHAGVNRSGKSDEYWRVVGKYDDIFLYNEQRRRERATGDVFSENAFNYWSWDSRQNRVKYDRKRLQAQVLKDSEIFIVTAVLVNHLVSAINAVRLTRKYNKTLANAGYNYKLVMNAGNYQNKYIGFTLSKSF